MNQSRWYWVNRKKTWAILLAVVFVGTFLFKTKLLISGSDSLPQRAFLFVKGSQFKRGNFVFIEDFDTKYYGRLPVVKILAGLPGDVVRQQAILSHHLKKDEPNNSHAQTSTGQPLSAIKPQIIPEGKCFVLGTHKRSLDSRYAEIGLISLSQIKGRAYAIF